MRSDVIWTQSSAKSPSSSATFEVTEVGINASKHFKKPLEHSKKVSRCTTDDPELLIPPRILNAETTPTELKNTSCENWDEKENEPHASKVAYLQFFFFLTLDQSSDERKEETISNYAEITYM